MTCLRAGRSALLMTVAAAAVACHSGGTQAEQFKVLAAIPDRMTAGNTAFIDTIGAPRVVEIDPAGKVVWQCSLAKPPFRDGEITRGADIEWIAEDNSYLVVIPMRGIFRIARSCDVVWRHLTRKVSHDADLLPGGNVLYTFGWDRKGDPQAVEIDSKGSVVWNWHAAGKIDASWYKPAPRREGRPSYTHANAVVRLPNGDTLVSLRNFHRVARVARDGRVRRFFGPIPYVHEPVLLPDGTFVAARRQPMRVVSAKEGKKRPIFKNKIGIRPIRTVQPLARGNFLLTGGEDIVEIDAAGAVVWRVKIHRGLGRRRAGRGVYKAVRIDQ